MSVENKLKFAMRDIGKSRSDIAEALQISDAAVSNKFYRDSFSAEDLIKIADCLGLNLALINDSQKIIFEKSDIKLDKKNYERNETLELFDQMRTEVVKSGDFMTDDEIEAEIQTARAERKARNMRV